MVNSIGSKLGPFNCLTLEQTEEAARYIASELSFPSCVYLEGEIGAGKTTLCKSIIKSFGYSGAVTSPTYNLIQEYPVVQGTIYHMDLYRLNDPSELEFLALEDLWSAQSLFLIEWPEKGNGWLREQNHLININKLFRGEQVFREIILR